MLKKVPSTYVIIFYIIIIAALLTWIIPGGEYIENEIVDQDYVNFFKVGLSSSITTLVESRKWENVNVWNQFQKRIVFMIKLMEEYYSSMDVGPNK